MAHELLFSVSMKFAMGCAFASLVAIVVMLFHDESAPAAHATASPNPEPVLTQTLSPEPTALAGGSLPGSAPAPRQSPPAPASAPEAQLELDPEQIAQKEQERIDTTAVALEQRMTKERRDPEWSAQTEGAIREMFQGDFAKGSALVSADCRASMCRVHIEHESVSRQAELFAELRFKAPFDTEGFVQTVGAAEAPESIVFVARRNQRLFESP